MNIEAEKIELIQLLLDSENETILQKIKDILREEQNKRLSEAHKKELDKRLQKNANGRMKFYSLEEFENRINEPE